MDPKTMTVEALKALAYDQLIELNRIQNNIKLIEAEIVTKLKEKKDGEANTSPAV